MAYGVVKIGDGLIGVGLQPGSALKDAGVQSARRIPITTGRLGQYSIVELSDAMMCAIEKGEDGRYGIKPDVQVKIAQAREQDALNRERLARRECIMEKEGASA